MAEVFMRATLRGVGHHDISSFPGRLQNLEQKVINPAPSIALISQYEALESYEGDNAPGEVASMFILQRAEHLADQHGIAFCAIRHSNHFLAAAPYVEKAAEDGYVGIFYTRGGPSMSAIGRMEKAISTCPMGFGFPTSLDYPVMMDFCLAYASMGLLDAKIKAGESVPAYWGLDKQGNPSTDPAAIKAGIRAPIGGHKGFGLSMLGEVFTGVLSHGEVIDEPGPLAEKPNPASQAVILIKADGLMPMEQFKARTTAMVERIEARAPGIHIPGQGSYHSKKSFLAENQVDLPPDLVEKLNSWAERLKISPLTA
jgi:LDH2 family malate/lactate/ureidoglycolate dehydrogenase